MTFTSFGRTIAIIAVVLGMIRIGMGLLFGFSYDSQTAARSVLGAATTGEAINEGMYAVLFGVVLGVLADISRALQSKI